MTYPVNVGRNIARETANSHYIFPSDIELYPSPGLISSILKMVTNREEEALKRPNPRVFVSSIFEIKEGHDLPETKAELVKLLKSKVVIPFHKMVCSQCHAIPKAQEWVTDPISGRIFDFFDNETAKNLAGPLNTIVLSYISYDILPESHRSVTTILTFCKLCISANHKTDELVCDWLK